MYRPIDFRSIFDRIERYIIFTDVDEEGICRVEMMNVFGRKFFECNMQSHYEAIVHQKLFKPVESGSTKSLKELILNAIKTQQLADEGGINVDD